MTLRPNTSPCTIGDVCDFESGNGFRPQDWKTKGLPIIRIQNLNGSDSFNYFEGEPDPSWIVETNDLLFAWAGVKGVSFGPTIWNGPRGVLNQHIYRIRPKKGINKRWLYYALLEVTAEIESKAHGFKTSLVHVRKADITRARLLLPGEHEQDAVATALGCWDDAIQKTERLIAAKERRHAWLLNGLINRYAARRHWNTVTLGDVILERSERSVTHNEYPALTSSRHGLFLQSEYFSKQVTSEDNTGYKIMRRGDFTFRSMSDDGRFVFNRLEKHEAGLVSPAYGVFHTNGVNTQFIAHLLNSTYFSQLLARETQGGTRKALRFSALDNMDVDLPPQADQESIAALLDESLVELELLRQFANALKTQKRGLMQKLLTGQWRLPVPEQEGA